MFVEVHDIDIELIVACTTFSSNIVINTENEKCFMQSRTILNSKFELKQPSLQSMHLYCLGRKFMESQRSAISRKLVKRALTDEKGYFKKKVR